MKVLGIELLEGCEPGWLDASMLLEHALRKADSGRVTHVSKTARKPRKPTLSRALAEAAKAGKPVRGAVIEADKIELQFGEPESTQTTNPWLDDLKVTKQ